MDNSPNINGKEVIKDMIKKIASVAGAFAMLAVVATPAGAVYFPTVNTANVSNSSFSQANTGSNTQQNYSSSAVYGSAEVERSSNTLYTQNATSHATGFVAANTNVGHTYSVNTASVYNGVQSGSFTGDNKQYNKAVSNMSCGFGCGEVAEVEHSSNLVSTGVAHSGALGLSVANTNVGHGFYSVNNATVTTAVRSDANTGVNSQQNYAAANIGGSEVHGSTNTMYTGAADSSSHAWTVVNTNWSLH